MNSFKDQKLSIGGREYRIQLLMFTNGCFLSISEGDVSKLGSMIIALKIGDRVESTVLIPSRYGGVFLNMLCELIANIINGIAIVSYYASKDLDSDSMRTLLLEIKNLICKYR
ncbi:MAG: hypothetical protein QW618_00685 [Nitrososphaerales archaeon]